MGASELEVPDAAGRRELVAVLARAFRDNPMNRRIHGPDPARRVRANRAGLRSLVLDLGDETEARVIRNAGRVVGGFVAVPSGRLPLSGASLRRQLGCLFWQGARAMEAWGFVSESLQRAHPTGPHWYLAVLGVDPAWQRTGVGGALLAGVRALADADRCPVYLESDRPESVAFYHARGFTTEGELRLLNVGCWRLIAAAARDSSGDAADLCDAVARRSDSADSPPVLAADRIDRSEVAP